MKICFEIKTLCWIASGHASLAVAMTGTVGAFLGYRLREAQRAVAIQDFRQIRHAGSVNVLPTERGTGQAGLLYCRSTQMS